VRDDMELFDTPGILWPKIDDQYVGLNLAYTGSIKDEILPIEEIALYFLRDILPLYPQAFVERYNVAVEGCEAIEVMDAIALKRGCIRSRHEVDYNRVSHLILDEFRRGIIGQLSLETPASIQEHLEAWKQQKEEAKLVDSKKEEDPKRRSKVKPDRAKQQHAKQAQTRKPRKK
jgi:ribosome biogenesis GTPase A